MTAVFKNLQRRRIDKFGCVSKVIVLCDVRNKVLGYEVFYLNDKHSDILDVSKFLIIEVH